MGDERVDDGQILVRQRADGVLDLRTDLLGRGSDALEGRDGICRQKGCRTSAGRHSILGVGADNGNLAYAGLDWEKLVLILEQNDGVGTGFPQQSADLGGVETVLRSVERDAGVIGTL